MRFTRALLVAGTSALLLLMAGCSSTKLEKPVAPDLPRATAPIAVPAPPAVVPQPVAAPDPLDDPNGILAKRSIYFGFDKAAIKDEFLPVVEAHARYLAQRPSRMIRIEGNCDERGSREYNLALGQRRADALAGRLRLLGVAGSQIETASFGKERPKATGHDEAAWAENRRDDLVYK